MTEQKIMYVRIVPGQVLMVADFRGLQAAVRVLFEEVEKRNSPLGRWASWPTFLNGILAAESHASLIEVVKTMLSNRTYCLLVPNQDWHKMPDWLASATN